jgi:oligopeptide/dipeptide ABC transporter ATP-binding protein
MEPVLRVENLKTHFKLRSGILKAVDGLSFAVWPGRVLCIVGESGSGKSVTALSIMGLIDPPGRIVDGRILYRGQNLLTLSEAQMETLRGDRIGMIFQDPMTSLNPVFTVGEQIVEAIVIHQGTPKDNARRRAVELMGLVGIPDPKARLDDYPHQFSGGMRQRALIAKVIACEPDVLIADEPTTALDVTIQAQILKLLARLQSQLASAMILITHDLGVVSAMADDVLVMYSGRMVEYGDLATIFRSPRHPYTVGLFDSILHLEESKDTELRFIPGLPPTPIDLPPGCAFRERCPKAVSVCAEQDPPPFQTRTGSIVRCHVVAAEESSTMEAAQ